MQGRRVGSLAKELHDCLQVFLLWTGGRMSLRVVKGDNEGPYRWASAVPATNKVKLSVAGQWFSLKARLMQ